MTEGDKQQFASLMASLAVMQRAEPPDVVMLRLYYSALEDLEIEFLTMAGTRLVKRSPWFPKPSELRAMAATIEGERRREQRELLKRLPEPLCTECRDTGWVATDATLTQHVARRTGKLTYELDEVQAAAPMRRCSCVELRRLERIGQRPWPALPAGTPTETKSGPLTRAESKAWSGKLRANIRVMPSPIQQDDADMEEGQS